MECQAHSCSWFPSPSPLLLPTESITIAHIAERRAVLQRIWSTRRFTPESIIRVQPVHKAADRDARRVELFGASVRGRVGHATVQAVQGPQIPQDPQRELLERRFARHLAESVVHASTGTRGDRDVPSGIRRCRPRPPQRPLRGYGRRRRRTIVWACKRIGGCWCPFLSPGPLDGGTPRTIPPACRLGIGRPL